MHEAYGDWLRREKAPWIADYGGPFCTYPWYAWNGTLNAFTYGGDYPGTTKDFGRALQFQQTENCASPADGSPQYCSTLLK